MSPLPSLITLLTRLKHKKLSQIMRFFFTRTPVLSILGDVYYHLKYRTRYYHHINRAAYRLYKTNQDDLNPYTKDVVSAIKIDGVYVDDIKNISSHHNILDELTKDAARLLKPVLNKPTGQKRLSPTKLTGIGRDVQGACLPNSFAAFFLSDDMLNIVNACHGMVSRLNYVDTWHNIPATDDFVNYTERWHRDHEDLKMIKVFVYLSSVDETTGPFTYLKGSQYGGRFGHINPVKPPVGVSIDEQQFAKLTSHDSTSLTVFTGEPGTIIICDATGIHKGGRTTGEPRTVVVATYTSDAGVDPHSYRLPDSIHPNTLSFAAKYAMRLESGY
jgi:hypothetical protein